MAKNKRSNNKQNGNKTKKKSGSARDTTVADLRKALSRMQVAAPKRGPSFSSILGDIGTFAGNHLSKIFGMGAYTLNQNSLFDSKTQNQVPAMHSSNESVTFRHREYIGQVASSTAFAQTRYAINPGLGKTFPYLCSIAQAFQEYQFRGLIFEYIPTSADALNSTNTALGSVMLAAQYRADALPFFDKQQLLNEMWSVSTKPSAATILPLECAPDENPLKVQYVRGAAVPAGQDAKLYDLATVTVATIGSQAVADVGELWCSYEVVFRKPQMSFELDIYGLSAHYWGYTADGTNTMGTSRLQVFDSIGLTFNNNAFTFPKGSQGNFLISYNLSGVAVTGGEVYNLVLVDCALNTSFLYGTGGGQRAGAPNSTASVIKVSTNIMIQITNPNATAYVEMNSGAFPTSSNMDIVITQVPLGFI